MTKSLFAILYAKASPENRHTLDERASIIEYDANLPREVAEQRGAEEFLQNRRPDLQ